MRISYWSSDVCSSDLDQDRAARVPAERRQHLAREVLGLVGDDAPARAVGLDRGEHVLDAVERPAVQADLAFVGVQERLDQRLAGSFVELRERRKDHPPRTLRYVRPQLLQRCGRMATFRSEEHTAELQSLMRHSYAVFCLQKKNN